MEDYLFLVVQQSHLVSSSARVEIFNRSYSQQPCLELKVSYFASQWILKKDKRGLTDRI